MAKSPEPTGNGSQFYRQLLMAQYDAYMKVAIKKTWSFLRYAS
jgi:hypothetical protein